MAGVALPPSREIVLGLGVWLIYLVDRVADARSEHGTRQNTARHVFSGSRQQFLRPLTRLIALALVILTPRWLPGAEFRSGLVLLALALAYYWLIHCCPGRGWAVYLPKEAFVGGMFGVGTAFFVFCQAPSIPAVVWESVALFASACFLNCAYITKWECDPRDRHECSSLLNAFPGLTACLGLASAVIAVLAVAVSLLSSNLVAVPVAVSSLLLAALDLRKGKMSADALRVAADVVLLTPWIGLAWLSAIT